jgi:uncharacterized protein (TIGR03083 family)
MPIDHLAQLSLDTDLLAATLTTGRADAPVAACPGWTVSDLGAHLATVQRWATIAARTGAPPAPGDIPPAPTDPAELAAWIRAGARALTDLLSCVAADAPTWHPFPVEPKVAGLWRRRQAHEVSVHRWDAEHAVGLPASIGRAMADDGIDEYWRVMLPRLVSREGLAVPASLIEVIATDTSNRWIVDGRSGSLQVSSVRMSDDAIPEASVEGDAEAVLLRLWGRPVDADRVTVTGEVAAAWLALGGA